MQNIEITTVTFSTVPTGLLRCTVLIRNVLTANLPENYTTVGTFDFRPNGTPVTPLVISGLPDGDYVLWVKANCDCGNGSFTLVAKQVQFTTTTTTTTVPATLPTTQPTTQPTTTEPPPTTQPATTTTPVTTTTTTQLPCAADINDVHAQFLPSTDALPNRIRVNFNAVINASVTGFSFVMQLPDLTTQSGLLGTATSLVIDVIETGVYNFDIYGVCSAGGTVGHGSVSVTVTPAVITWAGADPFCELQAFCADGFTLSPDKLTCTRITTIGTQTSEVAVHAAASKNVVYSNGGARLYSSFIADGTGTSQALTSTLWKNVDGNLTDGMLNKIGIWVDNNNDGIVDSLVAGKQLSISFNLYSPTRKNYYFGIAGDNQVVLSLNNTAVVSRVSPLNSDNFKFFHLYSIQVNSGYTLVTLTGTGDGTEQDCVGMEIYDNTAQQMIDATVPGDLTVKFSTKDLRGNNLQIVTCAPGYSPVDLGNGTYACQKVEQVNSTMRNTGFKIFANRHRLVNGFPDGTSEANAAGANYVSPVVDYSACPLPV